MQRYPSLYYYFLLLQFNRLKQKPRLAESSKSKHIDLKLVIGNESYYSGYSILLFYRYFFTLQNICSIF